MITMPFLLVGVPVVDSTPEALLWEAMLTCLRVTVCPVSSLRIREKSVQVFSCYVQAVTSKLLIHNWKHANFLNRKKKKKQTLPLLNSIMPV